ncbi:MAG TPA: hemerythrin domain-containing protein [Allosphingosinicella sp.]|nr:hemerythrin domain-containing protein [Allosphingosinicella sp.]
MTLRQTLQAAPTKTKELIEKLKGTSNQAVKTRESVFAELKEQMTLYLDQEEQHLLPLLRKHSETKALAADAAKGAKELRGRLDALDGVAKDTDEFADQVSELQALLQKYLRDERKELLPAVMKALDDEEAAGVAEAIESGFADAEKAKRDAKRKAAARAKREAERAKEARKAERAAARAQKAAEREAREQAEKLKEAAKAPLVHAVEQTSEAASEVQGALGAYSGTFHKAAADLRAVSASRTVAAQGASQFVSAWVEWLSKATQAQAEASRRMLECRNFAQLAEVQGEILSNSTRNLIEGNAALLEIAQQTSKQALRTLEDQRAQ